MQQVFGLMNKLLANAGPGPKLSSNKLSIRTFKVVPLSQRSGKIDFQSVIPMLPLMLNEYKPLN